MVSLKMFIDVIFPTLLWPSGWLTSNRNEYQEYIFGSQDGRCVAMTNLPRSSADLCEIWELQPPWILRASTGIAFILYYYFYMHFLPQLSHFTTWDKLSYSLLIELCVLYNGYHVTYQPISRSHWNLRPPDCSLSLENRRIMFGHEFLQYNH
jgi:hypothetical protein